MAMEPARGRLRRGRRDRARDRPRARHGVLADVRPEPRRGRLRARSCRERARAQPAAPFLNRATQGLFIPGLDVQGRSPPPRPSTRAAFTPESEFDDPGYCIVYGKRVSNFADQSGPEVFGRVTLQRGAAVLRSTPSSATSARSSGRTPSSTTRGASASTRLRRSRRPRTSGRASGLYQQRRLFYPDDPNARRSGTARFRPGAAARHPAADGDGRAAGVANGGIVMRAATSSTAS